MMSLRRQRLDQGSLFVIIAALAFLAFAPSAIACSCFTGKFEHRVTLSAGIFTGTVIAIRGPFPDLETFGVEFYGESFLVDIEITESWRGPTGSITLITDQGRGMCGFPFKLGQRYLVYTDQSNGQWIGALCSGTNLLDRSAAEIDLIRQRAPLPALPMRN